MGSDNVFPWIKKCDRISDLRGRNAILAKRMQQFAPETRLFDQNRSRSRSVVIRSEGLQAIDKHTQLNRQYRQQR